MTTPRWRIVLRNATIADLDGIDEYTDGNWGPRQVIRYRSNLIRDLNTLKTFPELGIARDEIFVGCRSRLVKEHIAYYYLETPKVIVVRILWSGDDPIGKVEK
jgi:plasmid stabilization system protein ParE